MFFDYLFNEIWNIFLKFLRALIKIFININFIS